MSISRPMSIVLVTGGSGTLGRLVVPILQERGHEVRTLSRTPGRGTHTGDLTTGKGVLAAAAGADLIVHAASDTRHFGRADPVQTRHLLDACTGARHLLYVSIVGIDDIPYRVLPARSWRVRSCWACTGFRTPSCGPPSSIELIARLLTAVRASPGRSPAAGLPVPARRRPARWPGGSPI